jgi:hypothetical protein
VPLPDDLPVQVCRLADQTFEGSSRDVPAPVLEILDRRYVLFVSTIVQRKNHALAEAWRQLWERLCPDPYLVLVGRVA